jgi:flagellin-specific chaperone FliS
MATIKKVKKYQKSGPPLRKPSKDIIEVETGEPPMYNSLARNMSRAAAQNAESQIKKLKDIKSDKERLSRYQDAINKAALETSLNYKKGGKVSKAKDGKWIQKAIKKPGALRQSLGVKKGETIPAGKLAAAAKKPGKLGQRARLAQTLKKMKKK